MTVVGRRPRAGLVAAATLVVVGAALPVTTVLTPAARADDDRVVVVGPHDLVDSGLWTRLATAYERSVSGAVIEVDYVAADDARAVALAEDRSSGVGVLLVDAPELEAGFVDGGHSAERHGRSVLGSDAVVVGPEADPAQVRVTTTYELPESLARIAVSGRAGEARFVSRGGTSDDTVREHALWALADGVATCTLDEARGGGEVPSTVSGSCPDPVPTPSWYVVTGTDQPATLRTAAACGDAVGPPCYALGGRGTARALTSRGELEGQRILARDGHPDRTPLTTDRYRGYAVAGAPDVTGPALDLLDWLTGPVAQAIVDGHLAGVGAPPYHPAAEAAVRTGRIPFSIVRFGDRAKVCGRLTHPARDRGLLPPTAVTLGYLDTRYRPARAVTVGRATTDARSELCLTFRPGRRHTYYLTMPAITSVVDADLGLRDTLRPRVLHVNEVDVGPILVRARLDDLTTRSGRTSFRLGARFAPVPQGTSYVEVYAGRAGTYQLSRRVRFRVRPGTRRLDRVVTLAPGRWNVQVRYDPGGRDFEEGYVDTTVRLG